METRNSTTSNGDKEGWEDGIGPLLWLCLLTHIVEVRPQLRQMRHLDEQHNHQRCSHEKQREGKQRIYLTDDLVDGQHSGNDIVDEDDAYPHHGLTTDGV